MGGGPTRGTGLVFLATYCTGLPVGLRGFQVGLLMLLVGLFVGLSLGVEGAGRGRWLTATGLGYAVLTAVSEGLLLSPRGTDPSGC